MRSWWVIALAACGSSTAAPTTPEDTPIAGLSDSDRGRFHDGEKELSRAYTAAEGLGPLYIKTACVECHTDGGRGPGVVEKMVMVGSDGYTTAMDQTPLPFGHTVRRGLAAGATTPIVPPAITGVKNTQRMGPQLLGRGYLEAIDEAEIQRVQAEQATRSDGIRGTINLVTFDCQPNPDQTFSSFFAGQTGIVGRFGLKARDAVLDEYVAGAYQGSLGLTSQMQPNEYANPDDLIDDEKQGIDLPLAVIDDLVFYLRRVAIPSRAVPDGGAALFDQALCGVCHVPSLRTRADYPIKQLADIDAPVFTDLLLHDMGPELADGLTDQHATSTTWRTVPLIGVRFANAYLHDGRATTVRDAIMAHGGEGNPAVAAFEAMASTDQATLISYVEAL